MSDQLKAVLNRCIFSSVLKLMRDEANRMLLGRGIQTFEAHDEIRRGPITTYKLPYISNTLKFITEWDC